MHAYQQYMAYFCARRACYLDIFYYDVKFTVPNYTPDALSGTLGAHRPSWTKTPSDQLGLRLSPGATSKPRCTYVGNKAHQGLARLAPSGLHRRQRAARGGTQVQPASANPLLGRTNAGEPHRIDFDMAAHVEGRLVVAECGQPQQLRSQQAGVGPVVGVIHRPALRLPALQVRLERGNERLLGG